MRYAPLSTMLSVKDPRYGAVGDGVTNDRAAIQCCFNDARGTTPVYFPPGSYFLGTNGGSTNILDLSALGDGITIRTRGFVELVNTCPPGNHLPRIFFLANNSHFSCGPIAFRDTNYDASDAFASSGQHQGAVGFYLHNTTPTTWGDLYFAKITCATMTAALIAVQTSPSASHRIKNIHMRQVICDNTYYGVNFQNDGDNVCLWSLNATQCRRVYYCYGVTNHTVTILDTNPRGSTGKCYIARQAEGLDTTAITIRYRNRRCNLPGTTLVAIDHIDLLGGAIIGIIVDVNVKESLASYVPVMFRNYSGPGGSESAAPSGNLAWDIRLMGSCDHNALACTTTPGLCYADKGHLSFSPSTHFRADQNLSTVFALH